MTMLGSLLALGLFFWFVLRLHYGPPRRDPDISDTVSERRLQRIQEED